jgi:hypothetical protein
LILDGGVLYVEGNLRIQGGLQGHGAVIATGNIEIDGSGTMTGSNGSAILAGGNVRLTGSAGARAQFRGVLYTEGNLNASHTNLAGSVVINADPGKSVRFDEVGLAESEELSSIAVPVPTELPGTPEGMLSGPPTFHASLFGNDFFGIGAVTQPTTDGGTCLAIMNANMNGPSNTYDEPPDGYVVTHEPTPEEPYYQIGVPSPMPADFMVLGSVRINNLDPGGTCEGPVDPGEFGWQQAHSPDYNNSADARNGLIAAATAWGSPDPAGGADAFLAAAEADFVGKLPDIVAAWNNNAELLGMADENTPYIEGSLPIRIITRWRLDLSRFFNHTERIRILSWRQI